MWRVQVTYLPASITVEKLVEVFQLPPSRICIPKLQQYRNYYAWINDFDSKQDADDFVLRNANLAISNLPIRCVVRAPLEAGGNSSQPPPPRKSSTPEPRPTTVQPPPQTRDPESERQLCPFANEGKCHFKDGECKFRHTRCQFYDSCFQSDCALAHGRRPTPTPPSIPRPCLSGIKCYKGDCRYGHPQGWSVCADGVQCVDYDCSSNHSPPRKKCPYRDICSNKSCKLLHPKAPSEECKWGVKCEQRNCQKAHPSDRTERDANDGQYDDDVSDDLPTPRPAPTPLISHMSPGFKNELSSEVIECSGAQLNFLEFYGDNVLKTIRNEPGMTEVKIKDGQLHLTGKSLTVKAMKSYLRETLYEETVTITKSLKIYLETKNKQSLWKRFLQKYSLGISFAATSAETPLNTHDSEGDDDDDDVKSVISTTSSVDVRVPSKRAPKFIQVSLCTDSDDSLAKAIEELRNYSLHDQSWALTRDEVAFILSQPQKERFSGQKTTQMRQWHWQIRSYLLDQAQSADNAIVQIFANYNSGVWHATVRGFKVHVNNVVSKIKSHLGDNVQTEVQLPISKPMAVFLRTKASSDIRQLEKTHRIKIANFSPTVRKYRRDKQVDDDDDNDHDCLKLTGPTSQINAAQASVEDFLESLSEQERHFPCPSWDVSRDIAELVRMRLKKLLESDDCDAIGCIKSYTAAERRNTTAKITVTIVGVNKEAVENVVEQCEEIVDGYVIWVPSTEEYRTVVNVLLVRKSPSIQEFKRQWDTDIRLDRETSSIIIPARSKIIADEIKEALLSLEDGKKTKVHRTCELIPIPWNLRPFVNQRIGHLLEEAQAKKLFVELKNPKRLAVHGQKESVMELKQQIEEMLSDIQQNLITQRLPLSSIESDFLRANTYAVPDRIEQETCTMIRDVKLDTATDTVTSSTFTTVINARNQSIAVKKEDITKATHIDAIINAANSSLEHAGGVDKAIADAAGPALDQECKDLIANNNDLPIPAGQAVKTTAGRLPFRCVIHAIGPQYTDGGQQERPLLFSSVMKSLQLAESEGCTSVAMPAISANTYGFPLADCTNLVVRAVKQFFADYPQSNVRTVVLMDIDDAVCNSFARELTVNHQSAALDDGEPMAECEPPPLTARWCWKDVREEKNYTDGDMRLIESTFQQYLQTVTAPELTIAVDNLESGTIANYEIHFLPELQEFLQGDPYALNSRLVCGYQIREGTGWKRAIIRYSVAAVPKSTQPKPVRYQPKPLDSYHVQMNKVKEYWNISGMSKAAVEQAEKAMRTAIQSAMVSEPFSVHLSRGLDDHEEALMKIAAQQHIEVEFGEKRARQLSMTLTGFKANVAEAKMLMALYAQDVLRTQVENDEELRPPGEWGEQEKECVLVTIPESDPVFVRIVDRMKETMSKIKVEKIERVQNPRMWNHYAFRRRELRKELRTMPNLQIEMELFHGTRTTLPSEVYNGEYGFDMTYSTSGLWGIGTYFAQNASYSCGSYAHTLPDGKKQIFLAQVLTGDVHDCASDPTLRRPPKKNETVSNLRYNSVSGVTGGSRVYIIYENRIAYPTYLITFNP